MGRVQFSINAESTDGRTLEVLQHQIDRRTRLLNETTEQACTAIAIQTTKSLRAATKKSNGKLLPVTTTICNEDLGISMKERNDLVVGWRTLGKGGRRVLCLKQGGHYIPTENIWWQIYTNNIKSAKCYEITLSEGRLKVWGNQKDTRQKSWILVSYEPKTAMERLKFLYEKLVKGASGIKRAGLTKAMMMISNKPAKLECSSGFALLDKMITVLKDMESKDPFGSSGEYAITVIDDLLNAAKLVGGEAGVQQALQKALNSTNGYLNQFLKRFPEKSWFKEVPETTPFPPESMG